MRSASLSSGSLRPPLGKIQGRGAGDHSEPDDGRATSKTTLRISRFQISACSLGSSMIRAIHFPDPDLHDANRSRRSDQGRARGELGHLYRITNRDGGRKTLAVPHALTAADKVADIASLLASLGVGIVASRQARQLLVQFLTLDVSGRITAVPQIGWHRSTTLGYLFSPMTPSCPRGSMVRDPSCRPRAFMCSMASTCAGASSEWIDRSPRP